MNDEEETLNLLNTSLTSLSLEKDVVEVENTASQEVLEVIRNEDKKIFENALTGNPNDILVSGFCIDLHRKDFMRLRVGEWLGDEVINFYLQLLQEREIRNNNPPKCYFFNTFFYGLLYYNTGKYNYQRVRRWTSKVDLFKCEKVIIPIHLQIHWVLAVINFKDKQIEYYDSMQSPNDDCFNVVEAYIGDEYLDKKGCKWEDTWARVYPQVPRQLGGHDCGVFMCKFAEYISSNLAFDFGQKDMPLFRQQIGLSVLKKHVD